MSSSTVALSREGDAYVRAVLGQRECSVLPVGTSALDAALHADSLWNAGRSQAQVDAAVACCRKLEGCEGRIGTLVAGIQALGGGKLEDAFESFSKASVDFAHQPESNSLLSVFCSERAINVAFWMACSGKMVDAAERIEKALGQAEFSKTPFVAGIVAFAQHMNGESEKAEKMARDAVLRGFNDPWTLHAVAHCMYSLGQSERCALWLEESRETILATKPTAFMRGHMEFHLALCFLDMRDNDRLLNHVVTGNLWGNMDTNTRNDYWNATGLLAVMWKAELRNVCWKCSKAQFPHEMESCLKQALTIAQDADTGKSAVFSICILRWLNSFGDEDRLNAWTDALESSPNRALSTVAKAVQAVYSPKAQEQSKESRYSNAAELLAPVAGLLGELGASPEQREVVEEFFAIVAFEVADPEKLDLQAWLCKNRRPHVDFYESLSSTRQNPNENICYKRAKLT